MDDPLEISFMIQFLILYSESLLLSIRFESSWLYLESELNEKLDWKGLREDRASWVGKRKDVSVKDKGHHKWTLVRYLCPITPYFGPPGLPRSYCFLYIRV